MESRTQGSRPRPRPRTQKKFKAKDSPSEDEPTRGQEQKCSRSRTQAQVFSTKKGSSKKFFRRSQKKSLQNFSSSEKSLKKISFRRSPIEENKKGLRKFSARFLAFSNEISTVQKIVLSSSRGQGYFRGLEASRPRPRTSKCVLEDSTSASCATGLCRLWLISVLLIQQVKLETL